MAMDPIITKRKIKHDYEEYIASILGVRDKTINRKAAEAIKSSGFVKGPYLEATLPFNYGRSLSDFADEGIISREFEKISKEVHYNRPLYQHQDDAVVKITKEENVIVATGTGSGKTECYMLPIFNYLMREKDKTENINIHINNDIKNQKIKSKNDLINKNIEQNKNKQLYNNNNQVKKEENKIQNKKENHYNKNNTENKKEKVFNENKKETYTNNNNIIFKNEKNMKDNNEKVKEIYKNKNNIKNQKEPIIKNNTNKNNTEYNKSKIENKKDNLVKNNSKKNENISPQKNEKEIKIIKNNNQNNINRIQKNYNKNIMPIKEELNENEEDTQLNISKTSQKNQVSSFQSQNNTKEQNITNYKASNSPTNIHKNKGGTPFHSLGE